MTRFARLTRRLNKHDGSSLVVVIFVVVIAALLAGLAESGSLHAQDSATLSGREVDATAAANAGLDLTIDAIGADSQQQLPCGSGAVSGSLGTQPAGSSYSVNVTYYSALPPTGSTLTCSQVQSGTASPAAVLVDSTGTTQSPSQGAPQEMEMEDLIQLTPVPGGGFGDAIFGNSDVTFTNQSTIDGEPGYGSDANVYSNGSISCTNSQVLHGSIYVQGSYSATNSCSADGTVYASGNVTFTNSATVGGNVESSGGSISMTNSSLVDGSAIAYGTVSLTNNSTVLGSIVQDAVIPPPPYEPFPSFTFSSSAWLAAGYTNQLTDNDCSTTDSTGVYHEISAMATSTVPTVIQTSCQISYVNGNSVTLGASLALITTGGFSATNSFTVSAAGSSPVDMFIIVPSSVSCSSGGTISFTNSATFNPPVYLFLYSPCNVTFTNSAATYGQIYSGGTVKITNLFTMTFEPLALSSISGVDPSLGFLTSIVYERQVPPGT